MAQAARDGNYETTLIGVSSVDLSTPTRIAVNPTTHALQIETDPGVSSINVVGDPQLTGAVTLSEGTNINLTQTGNNIEIASTAISGVAWGDITGTLSNQTDLQTALDGKFTLQGANVVNDAGADVDQRFEGDTATSLLVLDAGADAVQVGNTVAGAIADFRNTAIVLNEDGADRDIRMEGDTDTNAFYLDASTNRIGLGTTTPSEKLDVVGNFQVKNSGDTKSYRFRTSGADLDLDGAGSNLLVSMYSGAGFTGTQRFYLNLNSGSLNADAFGSWRFKNVIFGSNRLTILDNGECVVNDDSADYDFRVESDGDANNLFSDGGANRVGIGTNAPNNKLDVNGTAQVDALRIDQTPTAETPTATHTITISANGVNYKLLCVAA